MVVGLILVQCPLHFIFPILWSTWPNLSSFFIILHNIIAYRVIPGSRKEKLLKPWHCEKCFFPIQFASHSPQNIKLKNVFPKLKLFYILQNWKLSTYTTRISIKSIFLWVTTMKYSGRSLGLHSRNWIPVMFYSNTDCHIICSYISTIKVIKIFGNKKCEQLTGPKSQQWLNSPGLAPKLQIHRHIDTFWPDFPQYSNV